MTTLRNGLLAYESMIVAGKSDMQEQIFNEFNYLIWRGAKPDFKTKNKMKKFEKVSEQILK